MKSLDRVNVAVISVASAAIFTLILIFGFHAAHENNLKSRDHWRACIVVHDPAECSIAVYGSALGD